VAAGWREIRINLGGRNHQEGVFGTTVRLLFHRNEKTGVKMRGSLFRGGQGLGANGYFGDQGEEAASEAK